MRGCATRKRRFRDRIAAQLALAESKTRRSSHREETRAYCCERCRGWHLTSQPYEPKRTNR